MKTLHTPEPWTFTFQGAVCSEETCDILAVCTGEMENKTEAESEAARMANAARIVSCVNACAGIIDPGATIRDLLEALKALLSYSAIQHRRQQNQDYDDPRLAGKSATPEHPAIKNARAALAQAREAKP